MNYGSICHIVTYKSIGLAGMSKTVVAGNILLGGSEWTLSAGILFIHETSFCGLNALGNKAVSLCLKLFLLAV